MKVNLKKNMLDINKLYKMIYDFKMGNKKEPTLFMNFDTAYLLSKQLELESNYSGEINFSLGYIGEFNGYPIYNSSLDFGVVDLR